jgi:hypothetical protein
MADHDKILVHGGRWENHQTDDSATLLVDTMEKMIWYLCWSQEPENIYWVAMAVKALKKTS